MDIAQVHDLIERFRKATIGAPVWVPEQLAYEYGTRSVEVVIVLKLVRATHALSSMFVLTRSGLLIDSGAAARCIYESLQEVYFLLETYPNLSATAQQFVDHFYQGTSDGHLKRTIPSVPTKKIRAGWVRFLKQGGHDHATTEALGRIYDTFSGYIHASYAHVMEVYNKDDDSFCTDGVPHIQPIRARLENVTVAAEAVVSAIALTAQRWNRHDFGSEGIAILNTWDQTKPPT